MRIKVEKPSSETIAEMKSCPIWSKEVSVFDWEYDETETCYVMEGKVKVTTPEGEAVEFGPGDLVTFPRGLKCSWDLRKPQALSLQLGAVIGTASSGSAKEAGYGSSGDTGRRYRLAG